MGIVAFDTKRFPHARVRFYCVNVFGFMTIEAEVAAALNQQVFLIRGVWFVASDTIIHRIVLEFGFLEKIIVAIEAHGFAGFLEERFVIGIMRIMALDAVPGIHRAMSIFSFWKIVMTLQAKFFAGIFQ